MKKLKLNIANLKYLLLLIPMCSFLLGFLSGIFHDDSKIEACAEYASQVVVNHTEKKQYCALTVEVKDKELVLPDAAIEFYNLYGVFRQTRATFGSFYNFDKLDTVSCIDIDRQENYSFFYLGPIGSIDYNGHYKHFVYPFELMFQDQPYYDISRFVVYLSQSQADKLIVQRNITSETSSEEKYQKLIKTLLPIDINGKTENFVIANIYYETNYYYECMSEVAGEFFLMSYYLPAALTKSNVYFLSRYTFQNQYFMNYVRENYKDGNYKIGIGTHNIKGKLDADKILSFYNLSNTTNLATTLIAVAYFLLIPFFFFALKFSLFTQIRQLFILLVFFVPYLLFKLIHLITNDIFIFSSISLKVNLILFLALIGLSLLLILIKQAQIRRFKNVNYEIEINI